MNLAETVSVRDTVRQTPCPEESGSGRDRVGRIMKKKLKFSKNQKMFTIV